MWVWVCRFSKMFFSSSTRGTDVWSCHTASSFHSRHSLEHKNLDTRVWECAFLNSPSTDRTDQTDLLFLPSISRLSQLKVVDSQVSSRVGFCNWFFFLFSFFFLDQRVAQLGNIYLALLLYFVISLYTKVQEGCKSGGGDVEVMPWVSGDCFQLCFTRFLGGPTGGICWVASARKASAIRCGCEFTMDLKPWVSITSVACL